MLRELEIENTGLSQALDVVNTDNANHREKIKSLEESNIQLCDNNIGLTEANKNHRARIKYLREKIEKASTPDETNINIMTILEKQNTEFLNDVTKERRSRIHSDKRNFELEIQNKELTEQVENLQHQALHPRQFLLTADEVQQKRKQRETNEHFEKALQQLKKDVIEEHDFNNNYLTKVHKRLKRLEISKTIVAPVPPFSTYEESCKKHDENYHRFGAGFPSAIITGVIVGTLLAIFL